MKLACGECGHTVFNAVEQVSAMTPTVIRRLPDGSLEMECSGDAEFIRDMATSVTILYLCQGCDYAYSPDNLGLLEEAESMNPVQGHDEDDKEFSLRKSKFEARELERRKSAKEVFSDPVKRMLRVYRDGR